MLKKENRPASVEREGSVFLFKPGSVLFTTPAKHYGTILARMWNNS